MRAGCFSRRWFMPLVIAGAAVFATPSHAEWQTAAEFQGWTLSRDAVRRTYLTDKPASVGTASIGLMASPVSRALGITAPGWSLTEGAVYGLQADIDGTTWILYGLAHDRALSIALDDASPSSEAFAVAFLGGRTLTLRSLDGHTIAVFSLAGSQWAVRATRLCLDQFEHAANPFGAPVSVPR